MAGDLVVGVDAGGTSTRCVLARLDGTILARGHAGGANHHSSPDPAKALTEAVGAATAGVPPHRVAGGVFGIAGATAAGDGTAQAIAHGVWHGLGLPGTPLVINDILVAFASGSTAPSGAVLIAGTGAVAARVHHHAVTRICDGYGWLLGDEGSAVWLAVNGLRAALAAVDGRGESTTLPTYLAPALDTRFDDARGVLGAVYSRAPAELGLLAPLVSRAAEDGDPVARGIVDEAADRLVAGLLAVTPHENDPVVLAGSLLRSGPVAEAVHTRLQERVAAPLHTAGDGASGAAGLALRRAGAPAAAHAAVLAANPAEVPVPG